VAKGTRRTAYRKTMRSAVAARRYALLFGSAGVLGVACNLVANLGQFDHATEQESLEAGRASATGISSGGTGAPGGTTGSSSGGVSAASGGGGPGAITDGNAVSGSAVSGLAGGAAGSGTSGASGYGGSGAAGADGSGGNPVGCSTSLASRIRVTEVDVGVAYDYNEVNSNGASLGLTPLAIAPLPGGGSRLAFLGTGDNLVHIVTLDANDALVAGSRVGLAAYDFQDLYADASGGVVLVSRAASGSSLNHNCGNIGNLCGLTANYPTAASCYDMYMVRFDGQNETWAAKLTDTTQELPAYGTTALAGGNVVFIWSEYAHNGRIAFDGSNYAGYFGVAITIPNDACVGASSMSRGVNIYQGDRLSVVSQSGALTNGGFALGCRSSGYERVVWDPTAKQFITVCKNSVPVGGKSGRIAFPPATTIEPVDIEYSDLGSVALAGNGGYWVTTSDIRPGQPANSAGLADVHLIHVPGLTAPAPNRDITLVSDAQNDRAPHLAPYGAGQLLAAWEESTSTPDPGNNGDLDQGDPGRQMFVQVLDATTGGPPIGSSNATAGPLRLSPNVSGSRYQDFRSYPDGSVAYPAPGSRPTTIAVLRILGCK
jgi:hypothetical protein